MKRNSINRVQGMLEEVIGVYTKDECSIPSEMGKYILVQTSQDIKDKVLIKASDKTVSGLVSPEIVYGVKKKLGCIFVENQNP